MVLMTCAHLGQRRHQVGREQGRARLRKPLRHLLGDALDAGTAGDERVGLPALGAFLGDRQREAAVVALEPVAIAMLDQPGRALRAVDAVAAGAAQRERRIAAPVEEQQRLLLGGERPGHGLDQHRREPLAALGRVLAQVDGRHLRQLGAGVAPRQSTWA